MSFPRYSDFKASGVEWLGDVPAHWENTPLKHVADFVNGCAFKPNSWAEEGTPIIRIENLNGGDNFNFYQGEIDPRYHVERGALLFGWSGNRGTSFGPFIWGRSGKYFLNQHIFRVCGFRSDASWLYWCLKAVTAHVEDQAHGIIGMVHVTKGDLGAITVARPPLHEQALVANFLNMETEKIDALVAEQKMLIALLKEKRQALISHAVTKGLEPNAPMKESGIEWLGEVPSHWQVTHLKRMNVHITDGAHISPETDGGIFDFVSTKDVGDQSIDFDNCLKTSTASYEYLVSMGCRPNKGDVLFSKDGTIGRTVVVGVFREFVVASSLIIIRPNITLLDSVFLNFLCQSSLVKQQVDAFVKGAGLPRISIQNLLRVVGTFPPLEEQIAIRDRLQTAADQIDSLSKTALKAIELMGERRSALISAAVTGKIDVRGLASSPAQPHS